MDEFNTSFAPPYLLSKSRRQCKKRRSMIGLYGLFFVCKQDYQKAVKIKLFEFSCKIQHTHYMRLHALLIKNLNNAPPCYLSSS